MSTFERQLIGEIPLHEAAAFFVGMKQPVSREASIKTAGVRMKSAAQRVIDDLLGGKMPEGKAGQFKPVSEVKEAAAILKTAAQKLGFGMNSPAGAGEPEANMEGGQPTPAASNVPMGSMAPPAGPIQDPEAAKPSSQQTVPVNYMGAELMARAAQSANEVGFLRERLNAATEQNNALTQQVQMIQQQLDEVNQTQAAAGDQIMQASNEAVAASTRALEHSMQAANMRIGIQKMREAMMELASQDPESMGTLMQQQQLQEEAAMQQAAGPAPGAPVQAGAPATQPGAPAPGAAPAEGGSPEGGGSEPSKSEKGSGTSVSIKTGGIPGGMILPGALAGAGLAGLAANRMSQSGDEYRDNVQRLEGQQGSFGKAVELMKARKQMADVELRERHPQQTTARSALGGAAGGAVLGSALNHLQSTLKQQGITGKGLLRAL